MIGLEHLVWRTRLKSRIGLFRTKQVRQRFSPLAKVFFPTAESGCFVWILNLCQHSTTSEVSKFSSFVVHPLLESMIHLMRTVFSVIVKHLQVVLVYVKLLKV